MPESTILQPLTWNKSTRLCPWKLRQSRAHFVNEFALQQEEAKKNLAFFPQHFHKDINCALKDADRRNLSKLSSRERSALYSLETHKDTSEEFKDCQIFLQLGICQGTQTSLITRGSEKKKKKNNWAGESMERNWIVSHVKDSQTVFLIYRGADGRRREEMTLSCSSHPGIQVSFNFSLEFLIERKLPMNFML